MVYEEAIVGFCIGMAIIIFGLALWKGQELWREKENRPLVIYFNWLDGGFGFLGYFEKLRKITIPVENGRDKEFWAVETDRAIILPAYGDKSDVFFEDPRLPRFKILVCEIIGNGAEHEVQKEWSQYAFPREVYDLPPVLSDVPRSYLFVKPLFKRGWGKQFLKEGMGQIKAIFGEVNTTISIHERQIESLHSNYGDLIRSRIDSANQLVLSQWYHVLKSWDVISEYKVLPIAVMCRLLHIPMDKLNYTGLMEAVNSGNLRDVGSEVIGNFKEALHNLNDQFDMTPINKSVAQAMFKKVDNLQGQLSNTMQQNQALQSQHFNNLIREVQQRGQGQPQVPQLPQNGGARPVMRMYEDGGGE